MRPIDADALYEFCNDQLEKETGAYTRGKNKAFNIVKSALHNECATPTVQPEVRRGKWIKLDRAEHRMKPVDIYECSECGSWSDEKCAKNFCPSCGCKMSEDNNE